MDIEDLVNIGKTSGPYVFSTALYPFCFFYQVKWLITQTSASNRVCLFQVSLSFSKGAPQGC
jgi:hypothetical protein